MGINTKRFTVAALAVTLAGATPAVAQVRHAPTVTMTGAQFFNTCAPQGPNAPACINYITGISDGLQSAGMVCTGRRISPQRLYGVSMSWIRNRWQYSRTMAVVMLRNSLEQAYPCNARVRPSLDQQVQSFEKAVMFVDAVVKCVGWIGALGG